MDAQSAFSYSCSRCGQCCVDKRIQVNPYEIARLARSLGQGTASFRDTATDGAALRQRGDGSCIFFEAGMGCTVHADRPLVCRLFPLGRLIDETGAVHYRIGDFEPAANGVFGGDGTVDDFVDAQGARPFITATDAYFNWYLKASADGAVIHADAEDYGDLLDMDGVIAVHCATRGEPEPDDVEARTRLHLTILKALIVDDVQQG